MPDLKVSHQIINKRILTIPNKPLDTGETENIGTFISQAGQDGFMFMSAKPLTEERGTQRDPLTVVLGVELTFAKP